MVSGSARLSVKLEAIKEVQSQSREHPMLTAQDNAQIARAHYDAFNRRDVDKDLSLVTDDVNG